MNLIHVLLLMAIWVIRVRAEEKKDDEEEVIGQDWRWCAACMDQKFLKFAALYRNPDIGRVMVPPALDDYSCSKGQHLRVRCRDACLIVRISNTNLEDGGDPREHIFMDCSTYMLRTHVELSGNIDPLHVRQTLNFSDTFKQINKTVSYNFVMDDVEEKHLRSIVGLKGVGPNGKEGLEPQKGQALVSNNTIFAIIFFSAVSIATLLAYYWTVIAQFCVKMIKCRKSAEEPVEIQLDEVTELQSRIQK